jgi:hypothetical protein
MTRISVNRDGLDKGDERVWIVELPDGTLMKTREVRILGAAYTAVGQTSYGARLWIETDAAVALTDAAPL